MFFSVYVNNELVGIIKMSVVFVLEENQSAILLRADINVIFRTI